MNVNMIINEKFKCVRMWFGKVWWGIWWLCWGGDWNKNGNGNKNMRKGCECIEYIIENKNENEKCGMDVLNI